MSSHHEWRRPNAIPFVILALISVPFMLVFFDRWDFSPWVFALLATFVSCITLLSEASVLTFLGQRLFTVNDRLTWFIKYGLASAVGSLILVTAFAITGLEQDRAPFVLGIVFFVRILNTYLLAFMTDEVVTYRSESRRIRDELTPALRSVETTNALLDEIETVEASHEIKVITEHVHRPLEQLTVQLAHQDNVSAAKAVEAFIDETLRPLSHRMHPTSVATGITSAAEALGMQLVLDDAATALEATDDLLDPAVLLELHRWLTATADGNAETAGDLVIHARVQRRSLRLSMDSGTPASLDARHAVAGLRAVDAFSIELPLRGQFVDPVPGDATEPVDRRDHRLLKANRDRYPRIWTGDQGPTPYLVAALAVVAVPSMTFIGNAQVTAAIALEAIVATTLPVVLAIGLTRVHVSGRGWWPPTWIIGSWLGLGAISGLAAAATLDVFSSGITTGQWFAEITRSIIRLAIPGIAISLFGEFASQARNLASLVQRQTNEALEAREQILTREHERSRLIAEVLHRKVQSRLAAIVLLLRLDRRDEAVAELHNVTGTLVPTLIAELSRDVPGLSANTTPAVHTVGCTVTYVDSPELEALLTNHGDVVRAVVEECATNAQRHGSATRMFVSAHFDSNALMLRCVDDGTGPEGQVQRRGLGSRIFDSEVGADGWSLRRDNGLTFVEFRIPWQHGPHALSSSTHSHGGYVPG